jgi:hypothetical protein
VVENPVILFTIRINTGIFAFYLFTAGIVNDIILKVRLLT